ncbi:MAG TPA: Na-translocating system protein MpsB, partial [Prosthecobacter sp.]|nr:Na-translocating system protein MpsB [Prosthecobacter sp.]
RARQWPVCVRVRGGPNARAIAEMLNDPRVRAALKERGISVPEDTVFVGGMHNTANDNLTFYDVDRVPVTHQFEFEVACKAAQEAAVRNAHERARRFGSASLGLSPAAAKRHMEGRAEDLSQVRPEWGHATNSICIVGRRAKTRGLFLDRRAFLVSYDPMQDDGEKAILTRILGAVVPVCSGINLEYYFSYVDSPGWGSGSKLPHNITGLLGVMDGAMSDLRTGLPWQMVEIHEPVRLLFVIETTPEAMRRILEKNPVIQTMVGNRWVQLAVMHPETGEIRVHHDGEFEPHVCQSGPLPVAASSREWYAGWRDHLEFAEILPPAAGHN